MLTNINDYVTTRFKDTDLRASVVLPGGVDGIAYLGNLQFEVGIGGDICCARIKDQCDVFSRAGFLEVLLPNVDGVMPLLFDVRILSALYRCGLRYEERGPLFNPSAVRVGREIALPRKSLAWNDIGKKYKVGLDSKCITELCSKVVHVDCNGNLLYRPDVGMQSVMFQEAEDRFMAMLTRESCTGPGMMKANRIEALIGAHKYPYGERIRCHERLGRWMQGESGV